MTPPQVGFYSVVPVSTYSKQGDSLEQEVKKELFGDENYKYELIEKGYISPDGKTIINPVEFNEKLADAIRLTQGAVGDRAKIAAIKLMHLLGASRQDTDGIPRQAYDTSLVAEPIPGQNRIAYMRMGNIDYAHGLMLGGIGTGGIELTPAGIFRRIGLTFVGQSVEDKDHNLASQFHIWLKAGEKPFSSTLSTEAPSDGRLSAWKWNYDPANGSYHALYPMEWHRYEGEGMPGSVTVQAFSPVIRDNYQESSYPVVVYRVKIRNTSDQPMDASFMFTMQNLVGWKPNTADNTWAPTAYREVERKESAGIQPIFGSDKAKDFVSEWQPESNGNYNNVTTDQKGNTYLVLAGDNNETIDTNGQIAVAIPKMDGVTVSYITAFNANGDGSEVQDFYTSGTLPNRKNGRIPGKDLAGAIAFQVKGIAPGAEVEVPVVLSYDFPRSKQGKYVFYKRYTKFFGKNGRNAVQIAAAALENYQSWERAVAGSQRAIALDNPHLPDWYEGATLNKLNLLQTNSIGWFNYDDGTMLANYTHRPARYGLFIMAESNKVDYCHGETMDVRSYSFAEALVFPALDQAIVTYFAETSPQNDWTKVFFKEHDETQLAALKLSYGARIAAAGSDQEKAAVTAERDLMLAAVYGPRKVPGATPHDIWSAGTGPMLNTYTHQNPNLWPGLPPVGMLQALRNYQITADRKTFALQYEGFTAALDYAQTTLDQNQDSIPDFLIPANDKGIAIWTYDNWEWSQKDGINAYNAGLWLVSLAAAKKGAEILGKPEDAQKYGALLEQGKALFNRELWKQTGPNSGYYRLGTKVDDVFSDYLYFLYDKTLGLGVFPEERVRMTLQTVYANNVANFGNGYLGAVNGTRNGKIMDGEQQRETWSGASYALGATMLAYGMETEGWNVIYGTENLATNQARNFGDWGEAYTIEPGIGGKPAYGVRAKNYLRALSISDPLLFFGRRQ